MTEHIVDRGVVRVTGTEAATYLQGQISQDVEGIAAGTAWQKQRLSKQPGSGPDGAEPSSGSAGLCSQLPRFIFQELLPRFTIQPRSSSSKSPHWSSDAASSNTPLVCEW